MKYYLFIGIILICSISFLFINIELSIPLISENFSNAFNSNEESTRFDQNAILLSKFYESPIFGHGAAAEITGYKRSIESPWAYELSYQDDLFKTGILGFSFFVIFILGIFYLGFKLIKKGDFIILGLLAGLLSFLVANGTNPFFSSFDYYWPYFITLSYINLKNNISC
jgi:O-antigen ligase